MDTLIELGVKVATGALGGAAAALSLASWMARRQELGKAQAGSLLELRQLVVEQIAYNEYHHLRARTKGTYVAAPLSPQHQARVACNVVAAARKLSRRKQRKVRRALVAIFGEITVQCAELLAMTPFEKGHAVKDTDTWSAAQLKVGLSLASGSDARGSFDAFSEDPGSEQSYARITADTVRLQKAIGGGSVRLGKRR